MKVSNYKQINKGALVGAFDLALPSGMCIYGAMYMKSGVNSWCNFPGKPIVKDGKPVLKDGKQDYAKLIDIPDRTTRDKFNAQVIQALKDAGHVI